ncbi:MAG: DMP19 family protein [Acidobacteriota bacterium]|nr:DMP19 family protein [Acidobacteriota bacterium]
MNGSKVLGKIKLSDLSLLNTTLEIALFEEIIPLFFQKDKTELTLIQHKVLVTFIYDSEVLNGGHLQYLQNQGTRNIPQILTFLEETGAICQKEILNEVFKYVQGNPVIPVETIEQYQARAMQGEFFDFDMAYYKCTPEIGTELLPQYVNQHLAEFVEIE